METGLKGRVVIIGGASQGIGRATATAFAQEGARLAIFSRDQQSINTAAEELRSQHRVDVYAEALDITDSNAVQRFAQHTAAKFGRIDICVPNAGGPPAKNF